MFEARGYDGGTTNHIAAAASMSVGSLYQYFPNKDAILVALMVEHLADGGDRVQEALADPAALDSLATLVSRTVGALLALHRERPVLHQILMTRVPLPVDVTAAIEALEVDAVTGLDALLAAFPEVPVEGRAARTAMAAGTVNALVHAYVARPEPAIDDATFVAETTRMITRYLTAPVEPT